MLPGGFYQEYIDQLDTKGIKRYCKKCEYKDDCEGINDSPDMRFIYCDILQDIF